MLTTPAISALLVSTDCALAATSTVVATDASSILTVCTEVSMAGSTEMLRSVVLTKPLASTRQIVIRGPHADEVVDAVVRGFGSEQRFRAAVEDNCTSAFGTAAPVASTTVPVTRPENCP